MGFELEKYQILRALGIFGTLFGVYRGITEAVPLEDLAIILLIALTFYAVGGEIKAKKESKMKIELPVGEIENCVIIRKHLSV